MKKSKSLSLHEEVMLLALKDAEGTMTARTKFLYVIAGAVITELLLNNRITVNDDKKKEVHVVSNKPLGDPLLDLCLEKIKARKKPDSLLNWIFHLADQEYKHIIGEQLCRKGILRIDVDKILFIFSRKIYPEVNPIPEMEIKVRLQEAFLSDVEDIDPRTLVLLSLAHTANVLKGNYKEKELRNHWGRIEKNVSGDLAGKGTKETVEAVQAAISGMRDESLRTIQPIVKKRSSR